MTGLAIQFFTFWWLELITVEVILVWVSLPYVCILNYTFDYFVDAIDGLMVEDYNWIKRVMVRGREAREKEVAKVGTVN